MRARHGCRRQGRRCRSSPTSGHQEQVDGIVAELVAAHGPVDVLVSNAALASYEATTRHFLEGDLDWWERIIRTNLTSVFLCSRAVVISMAKRHRDSIIHMSRAHRAMASCDAAEGGIEARWDWTSRRTTLASTSWCRA